VTEATRHAVIASLRSAGGRWEVSCLCGRRFFADDRDAALAAQRGHCERANGGPAPDVPSSATEGSALDTMVVASSVIAALYAELRVVFPRATDDDAVTLLARLQDRGLVLGPRLPER